MNKGFYLKLAWSNLRKNKAVYLPYLFTCICSILMFFNMYSIYDNDGLIQMEGGDALKVVFVLGSMIIGIFALIFLFYTNSFLIKRRKKELGLYSILGMEKKHIAKVLIGESFFVTVISLVVGIVGGLLFSKLMFWALLYVLDFSTPMTYQISGQAIIVTIVLFLGIFVLTLCNNLWHIQISQPIELMRGSQHGEKEPKVKWLLSLLGFACLGIGYAIAVTVESPLEALSSFFIAVLFVIIGTYFLFTAGSILILKMLKKNPRFYYKPKNFVAVSGMLYRMKQNAAGLANICILSTMVLVVLSTTISLYWGREELLKSRYPNDLLVEMEWMPGVEENTERIVMETMSNYDIKEEAVFREKGIGATGTKDRTKFDITNDYTEDTIILSVALLEEHNQMYEQELSLKEGEVFLYCTEKKYEDSTMSFANESFQIKEVFDIKTLENDEQYMMTSWKDTYHMVVSDEDTFERLNAYFIESGRSPAQYSLSMDFTGDEEELLAFMNEIKPILKNQIPNFFYVESPHLMREEFNALYGGFFFLGTFLGTLFLMATVLIIYYKQISEGYDDRDRFQIMQKVGMSKNEIKSTIGKQILMVFFLPLGGAILHISVAFGVIAKLLVIFNMTNTTLLLYCTIGTVFVFIIFYILIYAITAKSYYRIVES